MKSQYKISYPQCQNHPSNECHDLRLQSSPSKLSMVCEQCIFSPQSANIGMSLYLNLQIDTNPPSPTNIILNQLTNMSIQQFRKYLLDTTQKQAEKLRQESYTNQQNFDIIGFIKDKKQELQHRHNRIMEKIMKRLTAQKQQYFQELQFISHTYLNKERQFQKNTQNRMRSIQYLKQNSKDEQLFTLKILMSSQYGLNALLSQAKYLQILGKQNQSMSQLHIIQGINKDYIDKRQQCNGFLSKLQSYFKKIVLINSGNSSNNTQRKMSVNKLSPIQNDISDQTNRRREHSLSGYDRVNTQRTKRNFSFENLPNLPRAPKTCRQKSQSNLFKPAVNYT